MDIRREAADSKRGYLRNDFEYFHLRDQKNIQFEFHYHDFSKIVIFISGDVTYLIEGKAYHLKPWDILLVNDDEIHKPIIDSHEIYERIVIWVNPAFIEKHNSDDCNLLTCFSLASSKKHNLLRPDPEFLGKIKLTLSQLEEANKSKDFGSRLLKNALFVQLMIYLNRQFLGAEVKKDLNDIEYDENIEKVLDYINENLREDLSIDKLASKFFTSKYYLMHKFKSQTGYSIHSYILQKRLILASSLLKKGRQACEASVECGFGDYSSFVRAFKKMFGLSPKKHCKAIKQFDSSSDREKHF